MIVPLLSDQLDPTIASFSIVSLLVYPLLQFVGNHLHVHQQVTEDELSTIQNSK